MRTGRAPTAVGERARPARRRRPTARRRRARPTHGRSTNRSARRRLDAGRLPARPSGDRRRTAARAVRRGRTMAAFVLATSVIVGVRREPAAQRARRGRRRCSRTDERRPREDHEAGTIERRAGVRGASSRIPRRSPRPGRCRLRRPGDELARGRPPSRGAQRHRDRPADQAEAEERDPVREAGRGSRPSGRTQKPAPSSRRRCTSRRSPWRRSMPPGGPGIVGGFWRRSPVRRLSPRRSTREHAAAARAAPLLGEQAVERRRRVHDSTADAAGEVVGIGARPIVAAQPPSRASWSGS